MGMNFFKKKKKEIEKKVSAYLLPNKIIIVTTNKKDLGTWYGANDLTFLLREVSAFQIGDCVMNHLGRSIEKDETYEQIKENWKGLIKEAKYKTEKAFLQDVKRVSIIMENNSTRIEPYAVHTRDKVFFRIPEEITILSTIPSATELGNEIMKSWDKCGII